MEGLQNMRTKEEGQQSKLYIADRRGYRRDGPNLKLLKIASFIFSVTMLRDTQWMSLYTETEAWQYADYSLW